MRCTNIIFSLSLVFLSCSSSAQELERRASLGVQVEKTDAAGIEVIRVVEGSSAQLMTIQKGDILLELNDQAIHHVDEFINSISSHREGEAIKLNISRAEKNLVVEGRLKGRPYEKPKFGSVHYGTVDYEGGQLRSILNLPEGAESPPVLFFIQGYSCRTIDIYWNEENRLRKIINGLVQEGIAVYRVEKPGMGDSKTVKDCSEIGYHEEVESFLSGLRALKASDAIDSERIVLFGHSLGGMTAPLVAAQEPVLGVINYGSVTSSWFEFLLKREREHGRLRRDNPVEVEKSTREMIPFLTDYLILKMSEHELQMKYSDYLEHHSTPYLAGRAFHFMQELQEVDITQALLDCNTHVLAIHAEADYNCIDSDWAAHTEYIVNSHRPGMGQWKLLSGTSHSFAKVGSLETFMDLREAGVINSKWADSNFNPELIDIVVDWIGEIQDS